jgi:hypothetical protein
MAALTHTRFAALALWSHTPGVLPRADYQIDLKVPRQHRSVRIVLQDFNGLRESSNHRSATFPAQGESCQKGFGAERLPD